MSIENLILGVYSVTVSYLIRYDSLLRQILLENATAMLLQNATEVYYKMRRLLQITTVQCHSDVYARMYVYNLNSNRSHLQTTID